MLTELSINHCQLLTKDLSILRWGGLSYNLQTGQILVEKVMSPVKLTKLEPIQVYQNQQVNLGLSLIPTGLGCSIGGFGGDASLCTTLLADEFDYLIVNPNVVNGGAWQNLQKNMLYVEGAAIDLFTQNLIALRPVLKNKIGLLIDQNISLNLIKRELEVIKAAETIWGLDFIGYQITEEAILPQIKLIDNHYASGFIQNPETILEAASKLIKQGAEAIAIITNCESSFEAVAEEKYLQGTGPDPIGGIEAICSHLITRYFLLPCAHAPCFPVEEITLSSIDKRVSPEITSYSFLPSVLRGLMQAPQLITTSQLQTNDLTSSAIQALIGPADCWMGSSFLQASKFNSYAVQSNFTGIGLTPDTLNLPVKKVNNYLELIGHLKSAKKGIKLFNY